MITELTASPLRIPDMLSGATARMRTVAVVTQIFHFCGLRRRSRGTIPGYLVLSLPPQSYTMANSVSED
jgi:hypothetical protein